MTIPQDIGAALQWHIDMGADECIADAPVNRLQPKPEPADVPAAPTASADKARVPVDTDVAPPPSRGAKVAPRDVDSELQLKTAVEMARSATTLEALREQLEAFDGCVLKKTATNLVFADGPADARLMMVGEAPGAEEDRQGMPFVGPSGQLLNAMLASIGVDRADALISNTVFWRPPGNRTPTTVEAAVCKPFIERLIEIVDPEVLVCVGAPSAHTLLGETQGISRLRGKWYTFQTPRLAAPINATALFHPAYLLRTPIKKREAWQDLLMIKKKLAEDSP